MKIEEYQGLAMRTSPENHDRVLNGCMGLIGETGEILDIVKKWKFQSGTAPLLPKEKLVEECGDVFWYCAELMTGLGADLAKIYEQENGIFDDMIELNKKAPIEIAAGRICTIATEPFVSIVDIPDDLSEDIFRYRIAYTKVSIIGIMCAVRDLLEEYCESSLEEAMEYNIAKLRKRYPDGFDPERSINRTI